DGGGGTSTGGGYSLSGTIGQPDASSFTSPMSGGNYSLVGGFWQPTCCPADLNGDGQVDGADIQVFIQCMHDGSGCSCADFTGNIFGQQSINSVVMTDGRFTVQLNDSGQFGPNAYDADRWLEIVVNGVTLSPRQHVTAAPYAQHAISADSARAATDRFSI